MQRWIAIGLGAMVVLLGGAFFAFKAYKQNRPSPIWVPLSINSELSIEKQEEIARELTVKMSDPKVLAVVSQDLSLAKEWDLANDEAAADELGRRMFIRAGELETALGRTPTIDVGVEGKVKERKLSEKIAMRLVKDVFKILGVDAPPKVAD
jgi:hypothetical protein